MVTRTLNVHATAGFGVDVTTCVHATRRFSKLRIMKKKKEKKEIGKNKVSFRI